MMENFGWVKYQAHYELEKCRSSANVVGWVDHRVPAVLLPLAAQAQVIVNIGVWKGASVALMADVIKPGARIWAVDHFRGSPDERETNHKEGVRDPKNILAQFVGYMTKLNMWGKVMPLTLDSVAASYYFDPGEVDLIYVDGGHDYESCVQDISNWLPKLAPGGIMLGDDLDWPGVRKAVDEMSERLDFTYTQPVENKLWKVTNE